MTDLRRRPGYVGVLGGLTYVERAAYGDETIRVLQELTPPGRKEAFALIAGLVENARLQPALHLPLSPDRRIKVRWTDDVITRFKAELPRAKNDVDLAARLGLPAYCRGAMRAARTRYAR